MVAGCLCLNCITTFFFATSSINNYPGGAALSRFNEMYSGEDGGEHCIVSSHVSYDLIHMPVHVYISNLAAQTGASLFLHTHAPPYPVDLGINPPKASTWIYNKTENISPAQLTADRSITHVIAEIAPATNNAFEGTGFPRSSWKLTQVVDGFDGWNKDLRAIMLEPTKPWKVVGYLGSPKLAILERRSWL